ncbi:MAG: trehalase family glycosidase [Pseudomonadota bacterium]
MSGMDHISLDQQARAILAANDRGGYTVPTAGLYPYQWNWDSAFAAWGFAQFDLDRAWTEVETLLSGQWDNGMVPHILFHKPDPDYFPGPDVWGCDGPIPSSGISQPPVAATFVRALWEQDRGAHDARLRALLPKLTAWHRWFMDWRTEDGAVCVTHPWESGRDNASDWDTTMTRINPEGVGAYERRDTRHVDPAMRPTAHDYDRYVWLVQRGRRLGWDEAQLRKDSPFRVADPTMTFILMRANRDLAAMSAALGQDTSEIDGWTRQLEAGAATLWNDGIGSYDSYDVSTREFSGEVSSAAFLCWFGGLNDDRMRGQIDRVWGAARYPVPSLDPRSAKFDAMRYWRGPTWAIMNTLIGVGMQDQGLTAEAERLRQSTAALIANYGFAEYFDPVTGTAAGGGTFTWTAAVWLAWASPSAGSGGM